MKKQCTICTAEFEADEIELWGRKYVFQSACEPCAEKQMQQREKEAEEARRNENDDKFWAIVPPLYRDTDPTRLKAEAVRAVERWQYNPKGIGIRGPSGTGKTRCAAILLKRMHDEGKRVFFLKATNLTKFAFEQFSEDKLAKQNAMQSLSSAMHCKVLLLDDVGKGRLSPSAEEQLYTILDFRSENGLPTIWTTNASASTLHDMMSEDRGDAIIRRLVEFSEIITTK